jgi:hypothetical protein
VARHLQGLAAMTLLKPAAALQWLGITILIFLGMQPRPVQSVLPSASRANAVGPYSVPRGTSSIVTMRIERHKKNAAHHSAAAARQE